MLAWQAAPRAQEAIPDSLAAIDLTFAPVVKHVAPAVVNIFSSSQRTQEPGLPFDDPILREFFGERFGAYPYPNLTVVHPPTGAEEAGGMEYPTLITTGGRWWSRHLGVRAPHAVTVHELGHQWFYGLVASDEHRWPFLDEGLTTYAQVRVLEERYPGDSAFGGFGLSLSQPAAMRYASAQAWNADVIAQPAPDFATGRDYGQLVYTRTATLLETLRRV